MTSGAARNRTFLVKRLALPEYQASWPASLVPAGHAVAADEGAIHDHVAQALLAAPLQDLVQVGGLIGQNVDGLVQVAVTGGLENTRIMGQAVHAPGMVEPAQREERLPKRDQGTVTLWGTDHAAVCGQESGEELDHVARTSSMTE